MNLSPDMVQYESNEEFIMSTVFPIIFLLFFIIGILICYILFRQDKSEKKNKKFLTSERLLVFTIEILIAVIGFGLTLSISNANEQRLEKEKAANMIQQMIEFTDTQITRENSYLNMYNKGTLTPSQLRVSNVINLNYYENILSSDAILQNVNMYTYGNVMRYLVWVENRTDLALDAKDELVYTYMNQRHQHLKDMRELLVVCYEELSGSISEEEAKQQCKNIVYDTSSTSSTSSQAS